MNERKGLVTIHGNQLTLVGNEIKVGDKLPEVNLLNNDLQEVKLSSFAGKTIILSCVPSLDTPVCDIETRKFNQQAVSLGTDVAVVTVSMDLPFAQKRWCGASGIDKVVTLSDHRNALCGESLGILIKELRLLARCIFVVDRLGTVKYIQLVKEVTQEPDYAAVLSAAKELK